LSILLERGFRLNEIAKLSGKDIMIYVAHQGNIAKEIAKIRGGVSEKDWEGEIGNW